MVITTIDRNISNDDDDTSDNDNDHDNHNKMSQVKARCGSSDSIANRPLPTTSNATIRLSSYSRESSVFRKDVVRRIQLPGSSGGFGRALGL